MLSSYANKPKPRLEIVPETRYVVFDGDEHSAQPFKLRGLVRLILPEPICIKAVTIRLKSMRQISYQTPNAGTINSKRVVSLDVKNLGATGGHKANKGNIEWPFEFIIRPDAQESVEGLKEDTWLRWQLFANVERTGWNTKDVSAACDIRVVRTLGQDQLESTRSRINADIWGNKVSYSVSIPTDAIVFGTSIKASLELSPLRKGLTFGTVEVRLIEMVSRRVQISRDRDEEHDRTIKDEMEVAKTSFDFPQDSCVTFDEDDDVDNPRMEDEKYAFEAKLPLPKSLKDCRQDVDQYAISITHRLSIIVNIHNPEGHVSQLVCRLPVKLFISPFLPLNDSHMVQPMDNTPSEQDLNNIAETLVAPPVYGSHLLDELYSDINSYTLMSQTASAVVTPFTGLSRSGSSENLVQAMSSLDGLAGFGSDSLNSALLEARLANLQASPQRALFNQSPRNGRTPSGQATPFSGTFDAGDINSRPTLANAHASSSSMVSMARESPQEYRSRRTSREHTETPPDAHDAAVYDLSTLSRVPSYDAALRTPNRVLRAAETPPSYLEATSRPPSPGLGSMSRPGPLPMPGPGPSFTASRVGSLPTRATNVVALPIDSSANTAESGRHLPEMQVVAPSPIPELHDRLDGRFVSSSGVTSGSS